MFVGVYFYQISSKWIKVAYFGNFSWKMENFEMFSKKNKSNQSTKFFDSQNKINSIIVNNFYIFSQNWRNFGQKLRKRWAKIGLIVSNRSNIHKNLNHENSR